MGTVKGDPRSRKPKDDDIYVTSVADIRFRRHRFVNGSASHHVIYDQFDIINLRRDIASKMNYIRKTGKRAKKNSRKAYGMDIAVWGEEREKKMIKQNQNTFMKKKGECAENKRQKIKEDKFNS